METERDFEAELAYYCDMVDTFKDSKGEYGWPDYKGTYERDCKKGH